MGEVYAGRHIRLDRDVAIKQLPEGFARNETVRGRFGDEARVLASLTHPHIVPVYDYVEEEGLCLLVMEALPGGTVWDRFTSEGISMPTACAVVMATCAGLVDAAPEDLVQVSDVLTPPEVPWLPIVAALVLAVVAVLVGLTGLGEPDHSGEGLTVEQLTVAGADVATEQPVEVDLAEPVAIVVNDPPPAATQSELALSAMGIPLGTSSAAPVQPGPEGILTFPSATALRLVPSGPVTAELRLLDDGGTVVASQQFGLDPDRAGYLTAGGVIAIVLVLLVLAYGSSSSARLRKGRQDRLAYPKLAVVGALGGVALTLSGWSFAGVELTAVTMIVAAGLGAAAAVFAGRAAFGLGRRRRLRRAVPSS